VARGVSTTRMPMSIVAVLTTIVLLSGCTGEVTEAADAALPVTPIPAAQDPGLVHVHGLGVNPADGLVYAATHFGLWQLPDEGQATRVGDVGYDLMGFTVVGPDHFQASGHPTAVDGLPPMLGLIESIDGGETWRSTSLLGEVDFHALRVAHDQVYGWSSGDGAFMVSVDGQEWDQRSTASVVDFVVDPDDPETILASTADPDEAVRLMRSSDGGRSWEDVEGPAVARLSWQSTERLWAVGVDGVVWHSTDGGADWQRAESPVPGRPEALVDTGDALYVAAGGAILESTDDGDSWTVRHRSE
jgi:hypothetical protein